MELTPEEMKKEEERLALVQDKISEEILMNNEKKRNVSAYIVEYRRNQLDDYKPDEDKYVDYFDHERFVQEESYRAVGKRLTELQELSSTPYFGKIGFREDGEAEEIYIGKYGLIDDKDYEPLIIDWRAPISALFYKGTLGEASYQAPAGKMDVDIHLRRQFVIRDGVLKGVFDSESDVKDEILLEVLASNVGKKLKDIIMTIQQEQNAIIRDRREGVVVVNGVAGSGKTTIALHRTAYLIYNYRKMLENKVLILGPNNLFMDYISHVLPSLGEDGAHQDTFNDLAMKLLDIESNIFAGEDFIEAVMNGDEELLADTRRKRSFAFKDELDRVISETEASYYALRDIEFYGKTILSKEEMNRFLTHDFRSQPYFKRALRLKSVIVKRLREVRDEKRYEIDRKYKDLQQKYKEETGENTNELDDERRREIREVIANLAKKREEFADLSVGSYAEVYRPLMTFDFLTQEDLAPMLYLKQRLQGIKLPFEVKHVVVDEAQEYSPVHFTVLREITGCSSFTIVGDSNQMLIEGESFMKDLSFLFDDIRYYHLQKSYRSTQEIMEFANRFVTDKKIIPLVRNGRAVEEYAGIDMEAAADRIITTIQDYEDTDLETNVIITRDMETARELYALLKKRILVKLIDTEDAYLTGNLFIMPSYYAKGLEFDGVVLVDREKDIRKDQDLLRYIMATRALHRLTSLTLHSEPQNQ
jgi:DNA helicase-2/ATP-dependent DNA helicase PcrA